LLDELEAAAASRPLPRVEVPGVGEVFLATVDQLLDAVRRHRSALDLVAREAALLLVQADDRLAEAGALLVPRRAWWECPPALAPSLHEADRLATNIAMLDAYVEGRRRQRERRGSRLRTWLRGRWSTEEPGLGRAREEAARELRRHLVTLGRGAGDEAADVPDVAPLLARARELRASAERCSSAAAALSSELELLRREVERRSEAVRLMGFDPLHLVAYFTRYGPPAVQVPFETEPGEVVHLATAALLGSLRRADRQPGGAGPVPAIGHTGLPGWVGSLRDRRARLRTTRTDRGTLLVSNRRLAFLGGPEPLQVALASVVDLDVYLDGVAVRHLGRDDPSLFLVDGPRHLAFYLNWAMAAAGRA